MIKLLVLLTVTFISVIYSQPSFALAKLGHQVVCQLAFDHLPTAKQQRIIQILNAVPREQQKLINQYNHLPSDSTLTFANACTWPDAIKKNSDFKQYKSWHYVNVSRDLPSINAPICDKNCLPQAIITHQQQLKSSPRSWQSAQALMFVGHWLGDIHQPLHVSYADDLGGNNIRLVDTKGPCNNLHSYWDNCLIQTAHRSKKQWVSILDIRWKKTYIPSYYSQQVWGWANESYQLVREPSFKYCQLAQKNNKQSQCLSSKQEVQIGRVYIQEYLPVLETQLLKAAKRLARLLDNSL